MSEFLKVAEVQEIPVGGSKKVRMGRLSIALFNIDGKIYAINNICPHEGGPLHEGTMDGWSVVCPWHGIPFDIRTGCSSSDEGFNVSVFETKQEGNDILLKVT